METPNSAVPPADPSSPPTQGENGRPGSSRPRRGRWYKECRICRVQISEFSKRRYCPACLQVMVNIGAFAKEAPIAARLSPELRAERDGRIAAYTLLVERHVALFETPETARLVEVETARIFRERGLFRVRSAVA